MKEEKLERKEVISFKLSDEERDYWRKKVKEMEMSVPELFLLVLYSYFKEHKKIIPILERRIERKRQGYLQDETELQG